MRGSPTHLISCSDDQLGWCFRALALLSQTIFLGLSSSHSITHQRHSLLKRLTLFQSDRRTSHSCSSSTRYAKLLRPYDTTRAERRAVLPSLVRLRIGRTKHRMAADQAVTCSLISCERAVEPFLVPRRIGNRRLRFGHHQLEAAPAPCRLLSSPTSQGPFVVKWSSPCMASTGPWRRPSLNGHAPPVALQSTVLAPFASTDPCLGSIS